MGRLNGPEDEVSAPGRCSSGIPGTTYLIRHAPSTTMRRFAWRVAEYSFSTPLNGRDITGCIVVSTVVQQFCIILLRLIDRLRQKDETRGLPVGYTSGGPLANTERVRFTTQPYEKYETGVTAIPPQQSVRVRSH